jgi:hypothetical protein
MLVVLHIWLTAPAGGTRESIVAGQINYVIKGALGVWPFIPLALLGPIWFLYIWVYSNSTFDIRIPGQIAETLYSHRNHSHPNRNVLLYS